MRNENKNASGQIVTGQISQKVFVSDSQIRMQQLLLRYIAFLKICIGTVLIACVPISAHAYTCNYFVDSVIGNDSNSGLSELSAWQTLRKVTNSSASFVPGDVICFRRGQRFYNRFNGNLFSSGTASNPITFGAYGSTAEPKPRLSNAELISNRPEWTDLIDGRYLYSGYTGNVTHNVWESRQPRTRASSAALTDGDWFYVQGTGLYYRPTSGSYQDHEVYFAVNNTVFAIPGLSGLSFKDLVFEYTGSGIYGTSQEAPISYVTVENCDFLSVSTGIGLWSFTMDGVPHENHHIDIRNNLFDIIRFAVRLNGSNRNNGVIKAHTATRTTDVTIIGNTVQNIALNGAFALKDTSPDVEAFSSQNLKDALISGNVVKNGIKAANGITNIDGESLISVAFIAWVHADTTIDNVRIEKNHFTNVGAGVVLGASPAYRLNGDIIANNIITNSELGVRLNSGDVNNASGVYNNTFVGNDINIYANSGGWGYQIKNNLSVNPVLYHVQITESVGNGSFYNNNMYVPDGPLFYAKYKNDGLYNLAAWKSALNQDANSFTDLDAAFVSGSGSIPEDYQLQSCSAANNMAINLSQVTDDFGSNARPTLSAPDIGAWEQ